MKSKLQSTTAGSEFFSLHEIEDADGRLRAEVRGLVRSYDTGISLVTDSLRAGKFRLKIRTILQLHRDAFIDVAPNAGTLRHNPVRIENSDHRPPEASLLPVLLEEMCDYVNDNWDLRSAIHLSAYVLWKLLWIHPFYYGNGTVARLLSYVVLSARLEHVLPGSKTIPEQIALDRTKYYEALAAADAAWAVGKLDVFELENLITKMLEIQLAS